MEFVKKNKELLLAVFNMMLFGSLYPLIKIGYSAFDINTKSISDILVFASFRFIFCGLILCVISAIKKEKLSKPRIKSLFGISFMGLFGIVFHYAFTYIGLSLADSSKTALLKQLGMLLYVCFAFLFIREESFGIYKIAGAIIGFCGIIAINVGSGGSIKFSLGDYFIIFASICGVISSILTKKVAQNNSSFWVVGISQFTGGLILFVAGFITGGTIPALSFYSTLVFAYICSASITGYLLWTYLQRNGDLSKLFIVKFAEPLFACFFAAIFLGEDILKLQYLVAFVLISTGIVLGNKKKAL